MFSCEVKIPLCVVPAARGEDHDRSEWRGHGGDHVLGQWRGCCQIWRFCQLSGQQCEAGASPSTRTA